MIPEYKDRLKHWIRTLEKDFYEPLGIIPMEYFTTEAMLTPEQAQSHAFAPAHKGLEWGKMWEYAWFRGDICLDERAQGQCIVMDIRTGGEATLFVNGSAFGTRRAEWVIVPHHFICDQVLTRCAKPGEKYSLLLEAYAGHDYPDAGGCATGPVRPGDFEDFDETALRQRCADSTYGVWHEEAYQLWLDVTTLRDALKVLPETSLRTVEIEEALERFTLAVDFEQPLPDRLKDYVQARALLRPVLEAHNGSTAPRMWAIGNAHIDLSWLWPYRETERKVARTFAQQIRLMEMYPDYKFIQSQPQAYLICKEMYPELYARIKEKIRQGQWIADGGMWVEPDTNMAGGEALIRQISFGKRFYQEEFGVDSQLLWLPDTFGYSAALPQILTGCGMKYMTTQKIFWTYNGGERFPYHYFTWQGLGGFKITSFLHMDYTSRTDAETVSKRWTERVQQRGVTDFLLPFGYGDGGGGPTRDHIEYALREKDLEGIPQVRMEAPQTFFESCLAQGAPQNTYVGELYFACHRGTYTSQAAVKKGNRRAEIALREAEMWSALAAGKADYPYDTLENAWKLTLLNQFHDILPGSSIARVYEEAKARYAIVDKDTAAVAATARKALTAGEGRTYFNSLSWNRRALVKTENGYAFADIPACGFTARVDAGAPERPVTVEAADGCARLDNGLIRFTVNALGEITACADETGRSFLSAPGNRLHLYKDVPRIFDAWDIDSMYQEQEIPLSAEGRLTVTESTPFRCEVTIERRVDSSVWTQRISLTAEQRQIDFNTHVDWHEKHRLLKAAFPTGVHAEMGVNEIQFGYMSRPTHRSRLYDKDRFEVCNHRYTALYDQGHGAAVLNDCKYGVSMEDDTIALTLLRAPKSPDFNADQGEHTFAYSYYVWEGSLADSGVARAGYELNVPVASAEGTAQEASLLRVDNPNVIIDAVKLADDQSGDLVVRLYESMNAACSVKLFCALPYTAAYECDMLENPRTEAAREGDAVRLNVGGFEVKTLRFKR